MHVRLNISKFGSRKLSQGDLNTRRYEKEDIGIVDWSMTSLFLRPVAGVELLYICY